MKLKILFIDGTHTTLEKVKAIKWTDKKNLLVENDKIIIPIHNVFSVISM